MMRRGNGLHNGFIRGVVIYERERLLDVIWDVRKTRVISRQGGAHRQDGDIEFMPDYIARGNLLPGSPSEGSPAADTEGQPTTAGGKSTRTTSTGVNKIQVESKHESVDLAPKHSSARSGDGRTYRESNLWEVLLQGQHHLLFNRAQRVSRQGREGGWSSSRLGIRVGRLRQHPSASCLSSTSLVRPGSSLTDRHVGSCSCPARMMITYYRHSRGTTVMAIG